MILPNARGPQSECILMIDHRRVTDMGDYSPIANGYGIGRVAVPMGARLGLGPKQWGRRGPGFMAGERGKQQKAYGYDRNDVFFSDYGFPCMHICFTTTHRKGGKFFLAIFLCLPLTQQTPGDQDKT